MTDLTELWKKGELLEGEYYVRCDWSDDVEIRYVHNGVDDWAEIVAPVPSYDELQSMNEAVNQAMSANIKLVEQNKQLKELLKECRNSLEEQSNVRKLYESDVEYRDRYNKKMDLLIQLDEVLNA